MINCIKLNNCASYGNNEQSLKNLNLVNFFYGDNGSGKSTVAKLIKNEALAEFSCCRIEWDASNPLDTLVYNNEFVEDTLRESKIPGVFTLGKEAVEISDKIEINKEKLTKYTEKLSKLSIAIGDKKI